MLVLYTLKLLFIYMESGGVGDGDGDGNFGDVSGQTKRISLSTKNIYLCSDAFHNVVVLSRSVAKTTP